MLYHHFQTLQTEVQEVVTDRGHGFLGKVYTKTLELQNPLWVIHLPLESEESEQFIGHGYTSCSKTFSRFVIVQILMYNLYLDTDPPREP